MTLVDDVKSRLDIVDIVSSRVEIKPAGRNFRGLCPFHGEKTPSFFVFPDKQNWRCFGACASGGDVLGFIMRFDNLDFKEALDMTAQQVGLSIEQDTVRQDKTNFLYKINELAADYYHRHLMSSDEGKKGLAYLENRGVTKDTIDKFRLGLSPSGKDVLKNHVIKEGFSERSFIDSGLAFTTSDQPSKDIFRGRIMFPISDVRSRVVGFGGRSLVDKGPKYINSPKTQLFDKGNTLYGLHLANDHIRKGQTAVIVEGYMDVIAAHQHGFVNVVASMGTALTERQVAQLTDRSNRFVLALDPDEAGEEATLRSLEGSWHVIQSGFASGWSSGRKASFTNTNGIDIRVALLPEKQDPDDVIMNDPDLWDKLIKEAPSFMDYVMSTLHNRLELDSSGGKARAAELMLPLIYATENTFEQDKYFNELANMLNVTPQVLAASSNINAPRRKRVSGQQKKIQASSDTLSKHSTDPIEERALKLLISYPEFKELASDLSAEHFELSENQELFSIWSKSSTKDELDNFLVKSTYLQEHCSKLMSNDLPPSDLKVRKEDLTQCIARLQERRLKRIKSEEASIFGQDDIDGLEPQALEINKRIWELQVKNQEKRQSRE